MAEPDTTEIANMLLAAIERREKGELPCPLKKHAQIARLYHWGEVAKRTERVYAEAMCQVKSGISEHFKCYLDAGFWFGIVWTWATALNLLMASLLEWLDPRGQIQKVTD